MQLFVLYVRSGKEPRVISDLIKAYEGSELRYAFAPFCPQSEYYYRDKHDRQLGRPYRRRPAFPGYVFIETDMPQSEFLVRFSHHVYSSEDIIRILRYGDSDTIALSREEQARFDYLFRGKRCLEHSVGYIEGERVVVSAGPLVGREGLITHINRHNRIATVRLDMFGCATEVKLALEIVEKR